MSRRPARATQADIRRAIAAAEKAGVNMAVDILPNGTIRLVPYDAPPPESPQRPPGHKISL